MKLSSQSAFQHLSSMRDMFSHLFSFFFFPPSLFLSVYLFYMIFKRDKSLIIFSRGNQKLNISFFTLFIHTQINSRDNICVLRGMVVMSIEGEKKKKFPNTQGYAGTRNIGYYVALPTQGLYCANCKQSVVRETAFYAATGNDIRPAQLTLYYFSPVLSYRTKSSWQENPHIYLAPNFEFCLSKRAFSPFHHKCPLIPPLPNDNSFLNS